MRILFVICFLLPFSLLGQDTALYCQQNASMFSDCYTFYKASPTDKCGSFEHIAYTDDGQVWFGKGTFVEHRSRFSLKYAPPVIDTLAVFISIDSSKTSDSVLVINKSSRTPYYSPSYVVYYNSDILDSNLVVYAHIWDDSTFLHKRRFFNNLFWIHNNKNQPFTLPVTNKQVIVIIEQVPKNPSRVKSFSTAEVLRKNKKGFKVRALFSNKRKEQFTLHK
jgi:hypothetical protein